MDDSNRRVALRRTTAMGLLGVLAARGEAPADEADDAGREEPNPDRAAVIAAGMTEAEADCWAAAADVAGKFFALPELHPLDRQEIATAVHVIQHRLLSRPTYRKYLEIRKAQTGKK